MTTLSQIHDSALLAFNDVESTAHYKSLTTLIRSYIQEKTYSNSANDYKQLLNIITYQLELAMKAIVKQPRHKNSVKSFFIDLFDTTEQKFEERFYSEHCYGVDLNTSLTKFIIEKDFSNTKDLLLFHTGIIRSDLLVAQRPLLRY